MAGFYLLTADGSVQVFFPFGEKEPKNIRGGPVIGRVKRPKRKELTERAYTEALGIQVSYMLDSWADQSGAAIEKKIRQLERLQGLTKPGQDPPEIIILGDPPGCVPHDYHDNKNRRWWIEDHTEDDGALRNSVGNRVRVSGIITLVEVSQEEPLHKITSAKNKQSGHPLGPKVFHVTHTLNTLSKIAAAFNIKGGWKTLARLNKIRDPKPKGGLKVGRKIRLR